MTQRTKKGLDFGIRTGISVKDIILKAQIYDDYLNGKSLNEIEDFINNCASK